MDVQKKKYQRNGDKIMTGDKETWNNTYFVLIMNNTNINELIKTYD